MFPLKFIFLLCLVLGILLVFIYEKDNISFSFIEDQVSYHNKIREYTEQQGN